MRKGQASHYPLPVIVDDPSIDWQQAECANHPDPELFFSDDHAAWVGKTNEAKKICRGCPIRTECFEYALGKRLWGIWGASTMRERHTYEKKQKNAAYRERRKAS